MPFGALSPDGVHYLSDDYAITYLPTASDVSYLGQKDEDSEKRMLVLSAAKLNGQSQVEALSGEARAVASLYGSEPRATSSAALSSFLREEVRKADLAHIVTRAETLPPDGTPDGWCKISLPAQQVAGLDLTKTFLVVVSGWECEVGPFNEAFLYAGAHSVITSLWDVDGDAAESFILFFYTHLRSGKSKAESFGAAQVETGRSILIPITGQGLHSRELGRIERGSSCKHLLHSWSAGPMENYRLRNPSPLSGITYFSVFRELEHRAGHPPTRFAT